MRKIEKNEKNGEKFGIEKNETKQKCVIKRLSNFFKDLFTPNVIEPYSFLVNFISHKLISYMGL